MMKKKRRNRKLDYVVRVDLCIDAVIIAVGMIALICFRGKYMELYTYLQNIDAFICGELLMFTLLVFLSFFTDIRYITSKELTTVVEKYAIIWIMLKIISIVFFLLSLLLVI